MMPLKEELSGPQKISSRNLSNLHFSQEYSRDRDIKETKLKVFSTFDRVESPLEKGLNEFIYGINMS